MTPQGSDPLSRDIVVTGASAGGIDALQRLVGGLPPELPAAVFIVQHLLPSSPSYLPQILTRAAPRPVDYAEDGEPIQPGHIRVAPSDVHLTLAERGTAMPLRASWTGRPRGWSRRCGRRRGCSTSAPCSPGPPGHAPRLHQKGP